MNASLATPAAERPATRICVVLLVAFCALWWALSIGRYYAARENQVDLGAFAQALHSAAFDGRLFYDTHEGMSTFGVNFSPILFVLVPIYRLLPFPWVLPCFAVLTTALAGYVLLLLARQKGLSESVSLAVVVTFLAFHSLHGVLYDNFYAISLLFCPAFLAWLCWERRNVKGFLLSCAWLLSIRPDVSFLVFGWGLFLALRDPQWRRFGVVLALAALAWLFLCLQVIQPHWNPTHKSALMRAFTTYGAGENAGALPRAILSHPGVALSNFVTSHRWISLLEMLFYFAFLPLRRPRALLIALPLAFMYLLADPNVPFPTRDHYAAPFIPYLVVAFVEGVASLPSPNVLWRWVPVAGLASLFLNPSPLHIGRSRWPVVPSRNAVVWQALSQVPPQAGIATVGAYYPWVCNRDQAWGWYTPDAQYLLTDETRVEEMQISGFVPVDTKLYRCVFSQSGISLYEKVTP